MKRPFGVYFIAFWFFVGFGSFTWIPISRIVLAKMINNPSIMQLVSFAGIIFIVYMIIGIIQLKTTQVWIAVAIFSMSAIFHLITAFNLFGGALADKFIVLLTFKIFVIFLSVGCVYYLLRSDFRSFQEKYLEIRRQESHAKWVQKNASKI